MRSFHFVRILRLECEHRPVAERRRFLVEGRAHVDTMLVLVFGPVSDPAAIGEFSLMAEGTEYGVIEFARCLAVLGADRHIANHVLLPRLAEQSTVRFGTNQERKL